MLKKNDEKTNGLLFCSGIPFLLSVLSYVQVHILLLYTQSIKTTLD
jgi:hypothetical protein